LADKLGPQWTKRELVRFYDAYRKYVGDWKKVNFVALYGFMYVFPQSLYDF